MTFTPSAAQLAYLPGPNGGFYGDLKAETITKICAALDNLFESESFFGSTDVDPVGPPTVDDIKYRLLHGIMTGRPFAAEMADPWRAAVSPREFD